MSRAARQARLREAYLQQERERGHGVSPEPLVVSDDEDNVPSGIVGYRNADAIQVESDSNGGTARQYRGMIRPAYFDRRRHGLSYIPATTVAPERVIDPVTSSTAITFEEEVGAALREQQRRRRSRAERSSPMPSARGRPKKAKKRPRGVPSRSPSPPEQEACQTCHGLGGVYVRKWVKAHPHHEGGTITRRCLRVTKVRCDSCTWPRKKRRAWPPRPENNEEIPMATEDDDDDGDKAPAPPAIPLRTCGICVDEKPDPEFAILITMTCAHEQDTCMICLQTHISTQVDQGRAELSCPVCPEMLDASDIQRQATKEDQDRYLELTLRQSLASHPDFMYCPDPSCQSGQIFENRIDDPIYRCEHCEARFCTEHNPPVPEHEGEACADYDTRIAEENEERRRRNEADNEASLAVVTSTAQLCPGCGLRIQKTAGCDHMTCSQCRTEFCYICGADYRAIRKHGNAHHRSDCRYHTVNLDRVSAPAPLLDDIGDQLEAPSDDEDFQAMARYVMEQDIIDV